MAFMIGLFYTQAQPIVSLQHGSSTIYFDNLDDAVNDALPGDLIVLSGGTYYLSDTLRKAVSIIGTGHFPDSASATGVSILDGNLILDEGCNNLYIDGLYLSGSIKFVYEEKSENVMIKRCNMNDLTFGGSHFSQYDSDTFWPNNVYVHHSIIRGSLEAGGCRYLSLVGNIINGRILHMIKGGVMENNVLLKTGTGSYNSVWEEVRNVTVRNNVFYTNQHLDYGSYACYNPPCGSYTNTIENNVFASDSTVVKLYDGVAIVHSNNLYNVTDLFNSQSGNAFDYTHNYHLTSTSPAVDAGFDGSDIGIYGGSYPVKEGGMPIVPWISEKSVDPATNSNGELPVYFKVKAQEH